MTKSKIYQDFSELLIRKFESESTIKTYGSCGYKFIYDSHYDSTEKLSNEYLLKYLTKIKTEYSPSKYNQAVSVLKILYNELLNQKSKLKGVKLIKIYPKLRTLPNIHDVVNKILNIKNIKHRAILFTLLTTGLRINELAHLELSDINSKSMKILIKNGKGGRSEFVIISNGLIELLRIYYKEYKPKLYLFEGTNGMYSKSSINNLVKKYIGSSYSAHSLRHIAITHVINKNIPLPKAKLFSRHKSNTSIEFYYHYDDNTFNELRDTMNFKTQNNHTLPLAI